MARKAKRPAVQWLSADQERRVRAALLAGATRDEAAALVGITRSRLDTRLRDQLADLRVGQGRGGGNPQSRGGGGDWDIDEAEIARRAALVRASWSPEDEDQRRMNFTGPLPSGH